MKYLASLFALIVVVAPSFATHFGISQIVVPVQTVQTVQTVVAAPVIVRGSAGRASGSSTSRACPASAKRSVTRTVTRTR